MFRHPRFIDIARVAAIVACVGVLYSPSIATIGLVVTYVTFLASGQVWCRLKAVFQRPLGYCGLAFLVVVAVGMTYASVPWHDRWLDLYKWRTLLWVFVILALFDEPHWKARFLVSFLVGTGVAAVASCFSVVAGVPLWRAAHEILRNASTQGMAFACAALVCLWITLEKKRVGPNPLIWPVLGLLYALNIVFVTYSRSAYVVLGGGLMILLLWKASVKQGVLILTGLLTVGALSYMASPRMQDIVMAGVVQWNNASESKVLTNFGSRRVFYENGVELLQEHWLLGVGTGGFAQAYGDHVTKKYAESDWRALHTTDPHNQYLSIAIQQGIGGVVLFIVWIAAIARERESSRDYHRLAIAILAGWCVTSLFSSHFRTFAEGHLLATFLGVLLAVENRAKGVPQVPPDSVQV